MKEIKRYKIDWNSHELDVSIIGDMCDWKDVEKLQKELHDARALLLAAIKLIPEDTNIGTLATLSEEVREVFTGKDKQTIKLLQEELRQAHEYARNIPRPPPAPVINSVFARDRKKDLDYPLQIFQITPDTGRGTTIGVYLP